VDTNTAFGSPHRQLVHRAEAWPADLLAVASHGRGAMGRLFFGSVAQACLHHCRRSVRICRTPDDSRHLVRPPRLLLATDGSAAAQEARRVITIRCWPRGTTVRVLSLAERTWMPGPDDDPSDPSRAQSPADARQTARRCAEEEADLLNTAGCSAHAVSYDGYPRRDIAADALREDVDAIFLGAVGHPLVERLLIGSVAASVAARAHCSVEIVRPPS
jgi:nucleotide-binding universal stress UspA family protein